MRLGNQTNYGIVCKKHVNTDNVQVTICSNNEPSFYRAPKEIAKGAMGLTECITVTMRSTVARLC